MNVIELLNRAKQIRDEVEDGANTAERVGSLLVDIIRYFQGDFISISPDTIEDIPKNGGNYDIFHYLFRELDMYRYSIMGCSEHLYR